MSEETIIDDFTFQLFGISLTEARKQGICICCKSPHKWAECEQTGLCKRCLLYETITYEDFVDAYKKTYGKKGVDKNFNTPCPPDQKRTPDNESENPPASQE